MNSPRHPLSALLLCGLLLLIPNAPAQAGSATWNLNPTSGDWNTAATGRQTLCPMARRYGDLRGIRSSLGISISADTEVDAICSKARR